MIWSSQIIGGIPTKTTVNGPITMAQNWIGSFLWALGCCNFAVVPYCCSFFLWVTTWLCYKNLHLSSRASRRHCCPCYWNCDQRARCERSIERCTTSKLCWQSKGIMEEVSTALTTRSPVSSNTQVLTGMFPPFFFAFSLSLSLSLSVFFFVLFRVSLYVSLSLSLSFFVSMTFDYNSSRGCACGFKGKGF